MTCDALLIGGSGYVGRALQRQLSAEGRRWLCVARQTVASEENVTSLDVAREPEALAELLRRLRPDQIYFLAGGPDPQDPFTVNIAPMRGVREALRQSGVSTRLIVTGSAAEYGDVTERVAISEDVREQPISDYGIAKLAVTRLALAQSSPRLSVVVGRVFNLIGAQLPAGLAPARFVREILRAKAEGRGWVTTGDLSPIRDFLPVNEAARCLVAIADSGAGGIVNVCSGRGRSMRALFELIAARAGVKLEAREDPALRRPGDIAFSVGTVAKLTRLAGAVPNADLEPAIDAMIAEGSSHP